MQVDATFCVTFEVHLLKKFDVIEKAYVLTKVTFPPPPTPQKKKQTKTGFIQVSSLKNGEWKPHVKFFLKKM